MNINDTVIDILKELSGTETICENDDLQEALGLDSLGMVTLLIELEDALNITLHKLWDLLSDDEQWLLTELVIKGRTDRALSAETGIHHGTLNYRKRAILKKLRKYFE